MNRTLSWALATAVLLFVIGVGTVEASAAPPDAADAGDQDDSALSRRSGLVQRYLINEFGDVEGILADDNETVRFPPHMSADVVAALKPGDRFVAEGRGWPGGGFQAYSLGRQGDAPLIESRPKVGEFPSSARDVRRDAPGAMSAKGTIIAILRLRASDVDAVVLDDGTIVKFPPRNPVVLSDALRVGASISAIGYGTRNRYGRCLRAERLGLDGQPLTPLQPEGPRLPPRPAPGSPPR